jgi:heme exporter protein CcmD
MGYVIAAYGVTLATIALYLAHLVRERRRLARELGADLPGPT